MRALALFVLGLAVSACSPVLGGPCSLDDPCEAGVCNLSGPGEPVCIDGDGDIDGDGLPNKMDFCNQQEGGAFDEDGDGLGDDCDACPIAPPPAQPDSDSDGVDSPCDPDPRMDGNQITVFNGFNGALPATWKTEGARWEVRGGVAVYTPMDPSLPARLTAPLTVSSRNLAVLASYRVNQVAAGVVNLAGLASVDRRPAGVTAVECLSSRIGDTDTLRIDSNAGASERPFPNLFDPAGLYRIAQLLSNANGACAMETGMVEGGVSAMTPGEIPNEAGLVARGAELQFQYLLIVQRPL